MWAQQRRVVGGLKVVGNYQHNNRPNPGRKLSFPRQIYLLWNPLIEQDKLETGAVLNDSPAFAHANILKPEPVAIIIIHFLRVLLLFSFAS